MSFPDFKSGYQCDFTYDIGIDLIQSVYQFPYAPLYAVSAFIPLPSLEQVIIHSDFIDKYMLC